MPSNPRLPLCLLALVVLGLFVPTLLRGGVWFAHDNTLEVGLSDAADREHLSNRRFSDQTNQFVPFLQHQLRGTSAGWIATWNPHSQLGRPPFHLSGVSKAYFLTRFFSWFSDNAFRVYTWLGISALLGSVLFTWLFCRARGLHPVACAVGALGLGLGAYNVYWLTFVLYPWSVCWTMGLLFSLTLYVRRPTLAAGLGTAFTLYNLLLTGYPQQVVWNGLLVAGFVVLDLARLDGPGVRLRRLAGVGGWAALGLACAAPVYLDLWVNTVESARVDAPISFYLWNLPKPKGFAGLLVFLAQTIDPFWIGRPVEQFPAYPVRYLGMSLLPVFAACASVSLLWFRRLWGLVLFAGLGYLMTFWPGFYVGGVELGLLALSPHLPVIGVLIALLLLGTWSVDLVLREGVANRSVAVVLAGLPLVLVVLAAVFGAYELRPGYVLVGCTGFGLVFLFLWSGRSGWILAGAAASVLFYGRQLLLERPIESIRFDSPLVDAIRDNLEPGYRFAWVDDRPLKLQAADNGGIALPLPANQEIYHGFHSVHTYNSLSPQRYQDWAGRISAIGTRQLGRVFRSIWPSPKMYGPDLELAGLQLLLCPSGYVPDPERFEAVPGTIVFRAKARPLLEAQLPLDAELTGDEPWLDGVLGHEHWPVSRTSTGDDALVFDVTSRDEPSLLFVSQAYHPGWHAFANGSELATVPINDFYQGVRVPARTETVELRFLPFVRWSWVPQLGFLIGFAALGLAARHARRGRRGSVGDSPADPKPRSATP